MPTASWRDVVRVCRQVCVLREQGQASAAEALRSTELERMLAALRKTTGDEVDMRVAEIFAAEEERVANAAVLAALLAPMLARSLPSAVADAPNGGTTPGPQTRHSTAQPSVEPPRRMPGDLADFIDDMLAQERSAAPLRRAS